MKFARAVFGLAAVATIGISHPVHAQEEFVVPVESFFAGPAVVVDATEPSIEASEGGSDVLFGLRLPTGATCPGDTANDGFQTSGFIVPEGEPIDELIFGIVNPFHRDSTEADDLGKFFSLREPSSPWLNENLPQNPEPGSPAPVVNLPAFTFGTFAPGEIPPGRYHVGLTCSFIGRPSGEYWDLLVDFAVDPDDEPAQIRWTVVDAAEGADELSPDEGGSSRWLLVGGLGAAAVFFLIISVVAGRSRETDPEKELV